MGKQSAHRWLAFFTLLFIACYFLLYQWTYHVPNPKMSTSSAIISLSQQAQLQEIADLMLQIYQTLAAMRYIPSSSIIPGPHDIDLDLAAKLELDPLVVYLHQILPYVCKRETDSPDFIFGGEFADLRDPRDVSQSRDPFYGILADDGGKGRWDEDGGEYIRPWVTPLSMMGNHQAVIIYDARKRWSTSDPALEGVHEKPSQSENGNNYDHIPSRPAPAVLKDIIRWHRTLEIIPGGGEHSSGHREYESTKELYLENGWPDSFDGDTFEIDQLRLEALSRARYHAEGPLRELETLKSWTVHSARIRSRLEDNLASTTDIDKEWALKLELWLTENRETELQRQLSSAEEEAQRLCPNGICIRVGEEPLWEQEHLRNEARSAKERIQSNKQYNHIKEEELTPEIRHRFDSDQPRVEAEFTKLRTAFRASRADAQRLCPDQSAESVEAIAKILRAPDSSDRIAIAKGFVSNMERNIEDLIIWAVQIPSEAVEATRKAEQQIEQYRTEIEKHRQDFARSEAWFAEHGNDSDDAESEF